LILFAVLGFLPGYLAARVLQRFRLLRIPIEIELLGMGIDRRMEDEQASGNFRNAVEDFINRDGRDD
ncbi:MAG: hypothetical protein OXC91_03695, partial [Rhodobacteraceae bacterium]|nr:hypothetical protein [Paracoccaceae bacterium]